LIAAPGGAEQHGQGAIYTLPNFAAGNFGQIPSPSVNPHIIPLASKYSS